MNRYSAVVALLVFSLVPSRPAFPEPLSPGDGSSTALSAGERGGLPLEVVVTATRLETPREEVASSLTVIPGEELRRRGQADVLEALREVPGLDVVRSGGPGGTATVLIRGAKSEHTLVLVDGVEVNDPSSPGRHFDFSLLSPEDIERVEILRGPQSTLYGSDAIGGVVQVFTRRGSGPPSPWVLFEAGSFSTLRFGAGTRGSSGKVRYDFSFTRMDTEGISAAAESEGNTEADGFLKDSFSLRLGYGEDKGEGKPATEVSFRSTTTSADMDEFSASTFVFSDDPDSVSEVDETVASVSHRISSPGGAWVQELGLSLSSFDREYRNPADAVNPDDSRASYEGASLKGGWRHEVRAGKGHALALGVEGREERAESSYLSAFWGSERVPEKTVRTSALYVQDQMELGRRWDLSLGARLDRHGTFGTELTGRIAPSFKAREGYRVKGSWGTGFKAPTLYQLYSPLYGNEELDAETSRGWDLGVEGEWLGERLRAEAVYFRNDFSDLVDWVMTDPLTFSGEYRNVKRARAQGWELSLGAEPVRGFKVRVSTTLTDSEDLATGKPLARRPASKSALNAEWSFRSGVSAGLETVRVGEREDAGGVGLDPYTLVNLSGAVRVSSRLRFFARVENALDEEYQEVLGYGTPGRGIYSGLRAEL